MKYRKISEEIEAHQWFKNGDYQGDGDEGEGKIVRYFRLPGIDGQQPCPTCCVQYHDHGFIETPHGGHRVCPGDWIVTSSEGDYFPISDEDFQKTYEPVVATVCLEGKMMTDEQLEKFREEWSNGLARNIGDHEGDEGLAVLRDEAVTKDRREPFVEVQAWNARHSIGTPVRYWTGARTGPGQIGETKTIATVMGGHTAVVWVTGHNACIALTHVEAITEDERGELDE